MIRLYQVITTKGEISLYARTRDQAMLTARELLGPQAQVLRVLQTVEW